MEYNWFGLDIELDSSVSIRVFAVRIVVKKIPQNLNRKIRKLKLSFVFLP